MDDPDFRPVDDDGPGRHALADVVEGLDEWFVPAGGDAERAWQERTDVGQGGPLTNGRVTVVAWRYRAEPRPEIWGVAAERGTVDIDGVSFVADDGDDRSFVRYIDWHGVFMQLGVAAAGHIVSEPRR